MSDMTVSAAEVEQFKRERVSELEFLGKLEVIVRELSTKVGIQNRMVRSMVRFLNSTRK